MYTIGKDLIDMAFELEFFKCDTCGDTYLRIKGAACSPVCCGKPMRKMVANDTDAAFEKHVPAVTKTDSGLHVEIGSTIHPMLDEHYIEWIAVAYDGGIAVKYLAPGDEPIADFPGIFAGTVYEHCNLHGLWKAEI